jgi:peptide/nickel transport system ATP-binding protein
MSNSAPLLTVRDARKVYGRADREGAIDAVNEVSFTVNAGEIVALVGESGSGKSSLARLVVGLERPDGGSVTLEGEPSLTSSQGAVSSSYRRRVQLIFQDPFASLNPTHTVRYHLDRALRQRPSACRPEELLRQVHLAPAEDYLERFPHELSGGEAQRVAIARALASQPDLLCADEPTSMLDVSIRAGILNLLMELRDRENLACILITHDLAAARYASDRVLVLRAGSVVERGDTETIVSKPQHEYTQTLLDAVPERWELNGPVGAAGSVA